ncbi:MAG: type II toxin-antitoxin system HicA family toxin [Muribaculum sp.]|nr:type II toxin-antitoxin system HicA family toxin [Muribaculum sp.]
MNRLLCSLGYTQSNKGKTSGSRVIYKRDGRKPVLLHKPHPGNIIKDYALKQILIQLRESKDL